jgi:hypothetical protein
MVGDVAGELAAEFSTSDEAVPDTTLFAAD